MPPPESLDTRIREFRRPRAKTETLHRFAGMRNVFLLGGITHVPQDQFPDHLDYFMAMNNLVRFMYQANPQFALLDNETRLMGVKDHDLKAYACDHVDMESVRGAKLCIAELSVPSTGTGAEIQEANHQGIPIIALAKRELREKVTPPVRYYAEKYTGDPKVDVREVQRGSGGISLMIEGNDAIKQLIVYDNNGREGRSKGLAMLNNAIEDVTGWEPITKKLDRALAIDQKEINRITQKGARNNANKKTVARLTEEMATLRKRKHLAQRLTTFDPEHFDLDEYEQTFNVPRLPLADVEAGLQGPVFRQVSSRHPRQKN